MKENPRKAKIEGKATSMDCLNLQNWSKQMKAKQKPRKLFWAIPIAILCYLSFGWKIPTFLRIETLDLPEGCETVYPTKIQVSDVYWLHTKGEKVIKCSLGYEGAKAYIEAHNSKESLKNISILPYGGMSDIAIYGSQYDETFWQQPDQDNYITISYFRKW